MTAVIVLASAACHRHSSPNVMTVPGVCDSIAPPVEAARRRIARAPAAERSAERGTIVGTIIEAGSHQPLSYGVASLQTVAFASPAIALAQADSLGGFAMTNVKPGTYTILVRALRHAHDERRIIVRADAVDTVRAELPYYVCIGY